MLEDFDDRRDVNEWVPEPTSDLDTENNVTTAAPDHLSVRAVFGETYWVYLPSVARKD